MSEWWANHNNKNMVHTLSEVEIKFILYLKDKEYKFDQHTNLVAELEWKF